MYMYASVWIVTPLIINTSTQQAPYTGDRARCAASTAPNTRGGTRESTAACGRRPGPPRSCRCSRSGDRHCETGSRGTNRPRVRPAAPPQPPLGCAAFCTGSCTRDRASSGAANRCPGSGDPPSEHYMYLDTHGMAGCFCNHSDPVIEAYRGLDRVNMLIWVIHCRLSLWL